MSLQNNPVRTQFVANCHALWITWNVGPSAGRPAARQMAIQQALTAMTNFMHPPTLKFKTMNDWGSFQWPIWTLKLKKQCTENDNIKYGKFVEFCSTIYHETRHAEQFYRIAQGLALGRLHYPDATPAEVINQLAVPAGGGGVQAKLAMFGGGGVAATPALPNAMLLSRWLTIPLGTAQHAHASSAQFDTFTAPAQTQLVPTPNELARG